MPDGPSAVPHNTTNAIPEQVRKQQMNQLHPNRRQQQQVYYADQKLRNDGCHHNMRQSLRGRRPRYRVGNQPEAYRKRQ